VTNRVGTALWTVVAPLTPVILLVTTLVAAFGERPDRRKAQNQWADLQKAEKLSRERFPGGPGPRVDRLSR